MVHGNTRIYYFLVMSGKLHPNGFGHNLMLSIIGQVTWALMREKPGFGGFANNTGADQPAHPRSLISAFVICLLKSSIS